LAGQSLHAHGIPVYDAYALSAGSGGEYLAELARDYKPYMMRSHVLHEALQVLANKHGHRFDLIEFSDRGGGAYIPVNMEKNFGCYGNSRLIVKLHSPSQWQDEAEGKEWSTYDDISVYHMERYQFENADIRVTSSEHLARWCGEHGWKAGPGILVCPDIPSTGENVRAVREKVSQWYDALLAPAKEGRGTHIEEAPPGITIIIPTRDTTTEKYLDLTLMSLKGQTYPAVEVIVQDSSTEPAALKTLEVLKEKYPRFTFNHGPNDGIGSALNQALPSVSTKYVMEVDGDNIARPEMVETFVQCMESRTDIVGLSCYAAGFGVQDAARLLRSIGDPSKKFTPGFYFKPLGMCLPLIFLWNVQGDANSIFLTRILKSIGGWAEEKRLGFQDWGLWLKLAAKGYDVDVVRKVLYYYRSNPNSYHESRKLYNVDRINAEYIKDLIVNRPEFFYANCYPAIQRMLRTAHTLNAAAPGNLQKELELIKNGTLYGIGVKLGRLADRYRIVKGVLEASGCKVNMMLGKD